MFLKSLKVWVEIYGFRWLVRLSILLVLTLVLDEFVQGDFYDVWPNVGFYIFYELTDKTSRVWAWYTNLPPGVQGALGAIIVGLFLSTQPNRFLARRERNALANSYVAIVGSIYMVLKDHIKNLREVYDKIEEVEEEYQCRFQDNIMAEKNNISGENQISENHSKLETAFAKRAASIRPKQLPDLIYYVSIIDKNSDKFGKMNPKATYLLTELYIDLVKGTLQDKYNIFLKNFDDIDKSEKAYPHQARRYLENYMGCVRRVCILCICASEFLGQKSLKKDWERDDEEYVQHLNKMRKHRDWKRENKMRKHRDWKREKRKVGF